MEDKECGGCHADRAPTYRDTFHGKATSLGFIRGALCSDCHGAHKILPKDHPESMVNKANLKETCGNCMVKSQNLLFHLSHIQMFMISRAIH